MITLERGMRHLAWADEAFFTALADRPADALNARVSSNSWTVGQLAMHIVQGAQWYRYCLTGEMWTDLIIPADCAQVTALRAELAVVNGVLCAQVAEPDAVVTFADEDGPSSALRSTILTQAFLHATEHRAQISAALEVGGYGPIVLDDLDLWTFERRDRVT